MSVISGAVACDSRQRLPPERSGTVVTVLSLLDLFKCWNLQVLEINQDINCEPGEQNNQLRVGRCFSERSFDPDSTLNKLQS